MSIHALSSATSHQGPSLVKGADLDELTSLALRLTCVFAAAFMSVTLFGAVPTIVVGVSLTSFFAARQIYTSHFGSATRHHVKKEFGEAYRVAKKELDDWKRGNQPPISYERIFGKKFW
jgi:MFS superfamily sulfate permease-like transporter